MYSSQLSRKMWNLISTGIHYKPEKDEQKDKTNIEIHVTASKYITNLENIWTKEQNIEVHQLQPHIVRQNAQGTDSSKQQTMKTT